MLAYRRIIVFTLAILGLCSVSVVSIITLAQVQPADIENHQDFRSGGATLPDMDANSPGPSSRTGIGPPPRIGPNARVNDPQTPFPDGLLGRSEITVAAINGGQQIVVGFNDAQGFCGPPFGVPCTPESPAGLSGFGFSTDGGLTGTDGGAPDPALFGNVFTRGDPWLDRGSFGGNTFFYANLSIDATTGADLGVSVHRGHFNGGSFASEDVRVFNAPNAVNLCQVFGAPSGTLAPCDFYDKEAITVDKKGSPDGYVSVTNFIATCGFAQHGFGQIEVWRTHDGGDTWLGPVIVSLDQSDLGCPGGILQQSSNPAIGPNGEVFVAWQFGPHLGPTSTGAEIRVARSLDGGVTFSTPVTVAPINSMRNNPPVGYNRDRINDHPRIFVATEGPNRGRVYVAYYSAVATVTAGSLSACPAPNIGSICRAQRLTSSQVFVSFSDDQGITWTQVPVAPAPPSTGLKRWWPVVTVEPGGNVDVIYYESQEIPTTSNPTCTISVGGGLRRRGTANSLVNTFWTQSTDGGATYSAPVMVSTATSNWCTAARNIRPNFGDYIGSEAGGNRILPAWADGRNGVPDAFFAQILGAGKSK
jgi:hypothetical protein